MNDRDSSTAVQGPLIVGCDRVGLEAAEQLRARGLLVRMADTDARLVEHAQDEGFDAVEVDLTDDDALRALGIGAGVKVLFALFSEDSANVFLTISARAMDRGLEIVALSQSRDSADKLLAAGASAVVDPYRISARKIHELIRRPLVAEMLEQVVFGQQDLKLAEVPIPENCFLENYDMAEIDLASRYNLLLLGAVDIEQGDAFDFASSGKTHVISPGDILVVLGPEEGIRRFKQEIGEYRGDPTSELFITDG